MADLPEKGIPEERQESLEDPQDDPQDDLLDDMPALGGELGDEEAVGVDEDLAPQLSTLDGTEQVGLDDEEAGMDFDPVTLLDLREPGVPGEPGEPEAESWIVGNEAAGDDIGTDGLDDRDASAEEYGWTKDNEAGPLDDWAEDYGLGGGPDDSRGGNEKVLGDDAGEEGVDDVVNLGGGRGEDDVDLPPLLGFTEGVDDEGMETLADDLDLSDDALIDGDDLTYEEEARLSGAGLPPALSGARLEVAHLGPTKAMVYDVARLGDGWIAVGEELYRVGLSPDRDGLTLVDGPGLQDVRPTTVCPLDDTGRHLAIGTRLSGVLVSDDGGASFTPRNSWSHGRSDSEVAFFVSAERHEQGIRLWGRTRSGALFRSEDHGQNWSSPLLLAPAFALADDGEGGVVVLSVPAKGPAQTARSDDGGHAWTMRSIPGLHRATDSETEYHIAALGPHLVVASDGHRGAQVSSDDGQSWAQVGSLPTPGAVCLVHEGRAGSEELEPTLYVALFFQGADRGVVVRRQAGEEAMVLDVRTERAQRNIEGRGDPEGDNRVFAIDARAVPGYTILMVATGAGLFRLRVRHG